MIVARVGVSSGNQIPTYHENRTEAQNTIFTVAEKEKMQREIDQLKSLVFLLKEDLHSALKEAIYYQQQFQSARDELNSKNNIRVFILE